MQFSALAASSSNWIYFNSTCICTMRASARRVFYSKVLSFSFFLQSFKGLSRSTRNSAFYSFRTMHPEKRRALLKLSENEKKSAFNAFTNTAAINFVYIHTFVNDVAMILMQRSNQSNAPDSPSSSHVQKAFLLIW